MARFDVFAAPDGGYCLDCQSDMLTGLNSRFVVPLRPINEVPGGDRRLNPVVVVGAGDLVMQTHLAAAVPAKLLRNPVANLISYEYEIGAALDVLVGRY